MKIEMLTTPVVLNVPGGSLSATHRSEMIIEDVGQQLRYREYFFVLKSGAADNGVPDSYDQVSDRDIEINDGGRYRDYETLVAEDINKPKARGQFSHDDVRTKAAEIRAR